jgi:hypothetical protein
MNPLKSAEGGEITHWMFKTIIKNSGNTPTKNMRWALGGEGAGTTGEPITIAPGLPLPSTAHDPGLMYDTLMKIHKFPRALLGPQSRLPVDIGGFGIPLVELRKISKGETLPILL